MRYFPVWDAAAIEQTLREWDAAQPGSGVLALIPESDRVWVPALQDLCAQWHMPFGGGIFPSIIAEGGFRTAGLWLLRLGPSPYLALYPDLPHDPAGAAAMADTIALDLEPRLAKDRSEATLLLIFDALVPNIATLLDELYLRLANRVHYAGTNAGSESFRPMPCLIRDGTLAGNGVLVALLERHRGMIAEHGYRIPELSLLATSTDGNRIAQIDWRPAFEVYRELVRDQYGVAIDRDNFYRYSVRFPFGIVRANHQALVRIPVALDDAGALFCIGEVPPDSLLTLLEAPQVDSTHTVEALLRGLDQLNGESSGDALLLFYCAGRRQYLGIDSATAEVADITRRSGARFLAGATSLGEIGGTTLHGYPLFHNGALVAARW